jgi:acyl-CoA dehydrogenase
MIYGDGFVKDREPGAIGWLIGEENKGLACMFTMMNNARLASACRAWRLPSGVPEGAGLCAGAPAGQGAGYSGQGMARSSTIRTCSATC